MCVAGGVDTVGGLFFVMGNDSLSYRFLRKIAQDCALDTVIKAIRACQVRCAQCSVPSLFGALVLWFARFMRTIL